MQMQHDLATRRRTLEGISAAADPAEVALGIDHAIAKGMAMKWGHGLAYCLEIRFRGCEIGWGASNDRLQFLTDHDDPPVG